MCFNFVFWNCDWRIFFNILTHFVLFLILILSCLNYFHLVKNWKLIFWHLQRAIKRFFFSNLTILSIFITLSHEKIFTIFFVIYSSIDMFNEFSFRSFVIYFFRFENFWKITILIINSTSSKIRLNFFGFWKFVLTKTSFFQTNKK